MDKRLELHEILCEIINITEPNGDRHVYFQPPESIKMKYPAIRYKRSRLEKRHANNYAYHTFKQYEIILIDSNPDSVYFDKIAALPKCRHDRHYVADNLNHDVFTLYY